MSMMQGPPRVDEDLDDRLADIGDRIRAERKAQGLSESALSERAGLDRGTLRRIQDGIGTLRHFIQVCAALGVAPDYLLSGRWVMPEQDAGEELWPISRVAEFLGASATSSARRTLHRLGVFPVGRQPGKNGESLYRSGQVRAAHAARPRRGAVSGQGRSRAS